MEVELTGEVWFWRGPAPFHFVTVPDEDCESIRDIAAAVSYGWGMVPVTVRLGKTEWTTSLWPKDGGYIVPIKKKVQDAEAAVVGKRVTLTLRIAV